MIDDTFLVFLEATRAQRHKQQQTTTTTTKTLEFTGLIATSSESTETIAIMMHYPEFAVPVARERSVPKDVVVVDVDGVYIVQSHKTKYLCTSLQSTTTTHTHSKLP